MAAHRHIPLPAVRVKSRAPATFAERVLYADLLQPHTSDAVHHVSAVVCADHIADVTAIWKGDRP